MPTVGHLFRLGRSLLHHVHIAEIHDHGGIALPFGERPVINARNPQGRIVASGCARKIRPTVEPLSVTPCRAAVAARHGVHVKRVDR